MATQVKGFQTLIVYNNSIWHIDYTAIYPDEGQGTVQFDVIYGDSATKLIIDAMKDFAEQRGLVASWNHVKVRNALKPEVKSTTGFFT